MVAGAVGLASAAALNWKSATENIKQVVTDIALLVGTAFLAIGAILTFSGVNLPLGIGLMAAGAVVLVSAAALNWSTIVSAIQGEIGQIMAIVSTALLVIGIILVASGVFLPLGIALIAAGAIGLVTVATLNWDAILGTLKQVWSDIKSWWNTSVAKFFTLDFWAGIGENILNGLLNGLKSVWSSVTNWVSEKVSWITDKFTSAKNSAPTTSADSASSRVSSAIDLKSIPALARGAVIPPNREFLAVLGDQKQGTNIEAPASEIEAAVARGMQSGSGIYGGQLTITIKPASGLTRYLSYELDDESKRRGYKLVKA